ncbi:hypothetical protein GIB67_038521, partial [Kingdonia uniflora]
MDAMKNQWKVASNDEKFIYMSQLYTIMVVPMALRAVKELEMLEIIAREGKGGQLSASVIASHLPKNNPNTYCMIDRILSLLASYSLLTCSIIIRDNGKVEIKLIWYHLKDALLEGGIQFIKANGTHAFDGGSLDPDFIEYNKIFNISMFNHTAIVMKKILETYKGFENLKHVVDVGGGVGTTISINASKYHTIQGVEHIGGDMFASVPKGETIILKWILNDWSDMNIAQSYLRIVMKHCRIKG